MRALLISNPNSTSITDDLARVVVAELRSVPGLRLKSLFTAHPGHATAIATGLTRDECDVVVCMGGDGTINEVVNGLLGTTDDGRPTRSAEELPAVAVIPSGSANVLSGSLGLPREPKLAARVLAKLLRNGEERTISVGHADGKWFTVNAGLGIDAEVISTMEDLRASGVSANPLRYVPTGLAAWSRMREMPPKITARVDGEVVGDNLPMAIVSNSNPWTFLGDLAVVTNPETKLSGGLGFFGLTSVAGAKGMVSALQLAGTGKRLARWMNVEERELRDDDVDTVSLTSPEPLKFQIDGEYVGERDAIDVTCARDAVRFIAPAEKREYAEEVGDTAWWLRLGKMLDRRIRALRLPTRSGRR
ncbi:diacylglycerol kinase family protein [uncultured Corynebacterium sp.]|uniref:diacylglycerol/lipid kinase family protein n=1 Tax=uncultured Corynebacterium sp. TaxID=159447 RepID=UPI0025ECC420|nr:diacylglycerol kinase family protein [uncultured Corynebacterium sp.]